MDKRSGHARARPGPWPLRPRRTPASAPLCTTRRNAGPAHTCCRRARRAARTLARAGSLRACAPWPDRRVRRRLARRQTLRARARPDRSLFRTGQKWARSRGNHRTGFVTWGDDHLNPGVLVVDALGKEHGHLGIIRGDSAHLVEGLVIFAARKDEPGAMRHTARPRSFIVLRADRERRRLVHMGSHTTSMSTRSTPGSRSSRARMSSWIISMAGQPIAV